MKVLIICHAGVGIGLGHLARSLVAARALRNNLNAEVQLLVQGDPVERDDLGHFDHRFLRFEENLGAWLASNARAGLFEVLLLDLHPAHIPGNIGRLIAALRKAGTEVVAIGGLLQYRASLSLLYFPSFHFLPPPGLEEGAPVVFGWDCLLLDTPRIPVDWQAGPRVLALSGGSDATGLGKTWPGIMAAALPADTELHWVTGPFAQSPCWPAKPRISIIEHRAPAGLSDLMLAANYAVTVFGVSFFELLYYGIPTVVFSPYGSKDEAELKAVANAGIALVANDEAEATRMLVDLMRSPVQANQLSFRARARLACSDGTRLCMAIENLLENCESGP